MKNAFGIYGSKPEQWTFDLPFKTKEEYLVWRSNWKKQYKDLSETIRLYRNVSRKQQSFYDSFAYQHEWKSLRFVDYDAWKRYQVEIKRVPEYASLLIDQDMAQQQLRDAMSVIEPFFKQDPCNINWLYWAQKQATWMLALRKASKIEAGRQQKLAQKQAVLV